MGGHLHAPGGCLWRDMGIEESVFVLPLAFASNSHPQKTPESSLGFDGCNLFFEPVWKRRYC